MTYVMRQVLAVLCGGALGAVCRVEVGDMVTQVAGAVLPVGILCVNMAGSLFLGLLMGAASRAVSGYPTAMAFFSTGFCGAFTTFSSFALDTVLLWKADHAFFALLNVGMNGVLCIALAALGWRLASGRRKAC